MRIITACQIAPEWHMRGFCITLASDWRDTSDTLPPCRHDDAKICSKLSFLETSSYWLKDYGGEIRLPPNRFSIEWYFPKSRDEMKSRMLKLFQSFSGENKRSTEESTDEESYRTGVGRNPVYLVCYRVGLPRAHLKQGSRVPIAVIGEIRGHDTYPPASAIVPHRVHPGQFLHSFSSLSSTSPSSRFFPSETAAARTGPGYPATR